MDKVFDLNHQFHLYLDRAGVTKNSLPEIQYSEMKRAFFGACGQMLILLRDDVGALPDEEAIEMMDNLLNQVSDFWMSEMDRNN